MNHLDSLGGGLNYLLCSPLFGEMILMIQPPLIQKTSRQGLLDLKESLEAPPRGSLFFFGKEAAWKVFFLNEICRARRCHRKSLNIYLYKGIGLLPEA